MSNHLMIILYQNVGKLQNSMVHYSFRQGNYIADILTKQGSRLANYDKTIIKTGQRTGTGSSDRNEPVPDRNGTC